MTMSSLRRGTASGRPKSRIVSSSTPLWRSPPLTSVWQTFCVSVTPAETLNYLTLQAPAHDGAKTAVLVDNIRLAPECGDAVVLDP